MKTLKSFLKDLLRSKESSAITPDEISNNRESTGDENQTNLLTQKPNQDEAETDESVGNPELDNPDVREDPGTCEELGQPESGTGESGEQPERVDPEKETRDFEREIEDAYQRGVIDGRNAVIEDKFFPSLDDGVPRFRGISSKENFAADIFSMAREA